MSHSQGFYQVKQEDWQSASQIAKFNAAEHFSQAADGLPILKVAAQPGCQSASQPFRAPSNSNSRHRQYAPKRDICSSTEEKETIREILGLSVEQDDLWRVSDSNGDLRMVHGNFISHPGASQDEQIAELRGVVVDVVDKVVVAGSNGQIKTAIAAQLESAPDNFIKFAMGGSGEMCYLALDQVKIFRGKEGYVIRVYQWKGRVYVSSFQKIDCSAVSVRGKTLGQLIDTDSFTKVGKDEVQFWMLTHPNFWLTTKWITHNDVEMTKFCVWQRQTETFCFDSPTDLNNPWAEPSLSLKEANDHLLNGGRAASTKNWSDFLEGWYDDLWTDDQDRRENFMFGEFLIIQSHNAVYRVESPGFNWRNFVAGPVIDCKFRFYNLIDYATKHYDKYWSLFPDLLSDDTNFEGENDYFVDLVSSDDKTALEKSVCVEESGHGMHFEDMIWNTFYCFLVAVNHNRRHEIMNLILGFKDTKKKVCDKIMTLNGVFDTLPANVTKRIGQLCFKVSQGANLEEMIDREYGDSLYRLVMWMQNDKDVL